MSISLEDVLLLEALEARIRALLPDQYQNTYQEVQPVSMGSAGLKYGADGLVAWNEIWATFCDLAMAGGPPHRGTLLEPAAMDAVAAAPEKHRRVVDEICRGVSLVTGLPAQPLSSGVCVQCRSNGMAGWLVRAIVMENVLARHNGHLLYLPAGPEYRIAREIKNVITAVAKTCHYWTEHMPPDQQKSIDETMVNGSKESELLEPASHEDVRRDPEQYRRVLGELAHGISERTGKVCFPNRYLGWIGIECPDIRTAIWLMRIMVVENVLARREDSVLFLPVHPDLAEDGRLDRLVSTFERANRLYAHIR